MNPEPFVELLTFVTDHLTQHHPGDYRLSRIVVGMSDSFNQKKTGTIR